MDTWNNSRYSFVFPFLFKTYLSTHFIVLPVRIQNVYKVRTIVMFYLVMYNYLQHLVRFCFFRWFILRVYLFEKLSALVWKVKQTVVRIHFSLWLLSFTRHYGLIIHDLVSSGAYLENNFGGGKSFSLGIILQRIQLIENKN